MWGPGSNIEIKRELACEPSPAPPSHNRSHGGRQPGRTNPPTPSALTGTNAAKTVVPGLARTRGNVKSSQSQLNHQN
jgi:hypothetical protein